MLRSMYSGISGLKNFQTKLDVIGNNIANVNTYGFKKSRVTFADTMNQTLSGASASTANRGGKNSMQVGLGSAVSTIDTIHTQSSLQNTGRSLDLGISGDGYFVVANGNALSYTRAGNFYLDNNGTLVNGDGYKVQAYQVDANGNMTNQYGDIAVNVNAVMPAVATTNLKVSENLAANATKGSVFSQQMKVVDATGIARDATVYFKKLANNEWGVYANTEPKDASVTINGDVKITDPTAYTGTTSQEWNLFYDATGYRVELPGTPVTSIPLTLNATTKKLSATNAVDAPKLQGLQLDVSAIENPPSSTVTQTVGTGSGDIKITDPTAYTLGVDTQYTITYDAGDPLATPLPIAPSYSISTDGGATSVTLAIASNKAIQDGLELDFSGISPTDGDTWVVDAKAKTPQVISTAPAPPVPISTIKVDPATKPNHTLNFVDGNILNNVSKADLSFDISTGLKDDAETTANESLQKVTLNFDFSTLTQNDGTTTALVNPDGSTEGSLESFTIGQTGEISGVYSNGEVNTLGVLAIAKFSNTSGLTKTGGNLFQESISSGTANIGLAGDGRGTLAAGSLEMSNVDLSEEFTDMIVAQRGLQANTRIITTSDEILQELVNLKR